MADSNEIKSLIESIKTKVGPEVVEKVEDELITLSSKVNSVFQNNKEQEVEIAQLRRESGERRKALKDYEREMQLKIEDYEDKIATLEESGNSEELEAEVTRLRGFEKNYYEDQRKEFKGFIEKNKDDDRFDKVKGRFKLPTNDDGIDFEKFDSIEHDDLKHNIYQMKDLLELEYFDTAKNDGSPPVGGKAQRGADKTFADEMHEAKSRKEIDEVIAKHGGLK